MQIDAYAMHAARCRETHPTQQARPATVIRADFFAEILDEHFVEFSSVGCQQPSIQVWSTTKSTAELQFTNSIRAENLARARPRLATGRCRCLRMCGAA
jgi:hypothetical protein